MLDDIAIKFQDVSKEYKIYPSPLYFMMDLLKFPFYRKKRGSFRTFKALSNIDFTIKKGERVGIVGRNGAGKSTLLKLVTQNYSPTKGQVFVGGKVQGLMDAGLGFHPEFSGMENIKASLAYNGLSSKERELAIADILDFVELDEFIHQPIKTYSLGMATRLAFATATAIKPEILIIDEVMSAGDAYFSTKATLRMKRLTGSGTTLLLVSHSNEQILSYCERAIWLNQGEVMAQGSSVEIIKLYDAFIKDLEERRLADKNIKDFIKSRVSAEIITDDISKNQISSWGGAEGPRITQVQMFDPGGSESFVHVTGNKMTIRIRFCSNTGGNFPVHYHAYIFTLDGRTLSLHLTECKMLNLAAKEESYVDLVYDQLLLGNGDYMMTVGLYKSINMQDPTSAVRYDILDRSVQFKVIDKIRYDQSLFHHPAYWMESSQSKIEDHSSIVLE